MIIFVIELDLWDSNIVFLCKCFRISEWHISGTGGQIWLLKKGKSIRMLKIIIPMIIFLIHMYLWGSDAVFLWRYLHISTRTNFRIGRLKSTSGRSKLLKIIIGLILFPIHKYLWRTDAVFLWRYPHISRRTNFELEGWSELLAEANCLKSSSGRSYLWWNWICEILALYFSAMQFIILQCTRIYYTAVHCNLLYCSALQSNILQ